MKKLFLAAFLQTCIMLCFAQLKSPDEFLGYQLGIKWTPHFKIVNYFNYTASNSPFNMRLEKYGETNISKTTYYKQKMLDNYKSKHKSLNILGTDGYNVNILCDKCGQTSELTKQLIYEREMVGSEVCIICNPLNQNCVSRYETELADYLSILGVESIPSYRKLEGNKEIDVFIPSKNIPHI